MNKRSTASTDTPVNYHRVEINTQVQSTSFGGTIITVNTPEPIVINAEANNANTGSLVVSASDSVAYQLSECNKDVVTVNTVVSGQAEQTQLSWMDSNNPLAQFKLPLRFLTHDDNNSLYSEASAAYSAEQNIEGC